MLKVILTIDGGGCRGHLPALAIQRLENLTRKPARDVVSFISGTSTGALLASAIAIGLPAACMVEVYRNRLGDIFKPSAPWHDIRQWTVGHKYDIANLDKVLRQEFGSSSHAKTNDSPIDILLTAKAVSDGKQWYFTRDHSANAKTTGDLDLVTCACASAAAPTYFDPVSMPYPPVSDKLVDGGTGVAGNPVYEACVEAFEYHDYKPKDTIVISFGTGRFIHKENPSSILDWLSWTLDVLLNSPEEQQTELVRRHYPVAAFYRLDPELPSKIAMDDISKIEDLDNIGKLFATQVDWNAMLNCEKTQFMVSKEGKSV